MYKFYHGTFFPTIEGGGGKENKQKTIGTPGSAFSIGYRVGEAEKMRWYNGEEFSKKKGPACVFSV